MVLPDADDPPLPFDDPTQHRYEIIRPVVVIGNRTATERGPNIEKVSYGATYARRYL